MTYCFVELYNLLGPAFEPYMKALQPVQRKLIVMYIAMLGSKKKPQEE